MSAYLEERLVRLEAHITHLERLHEELNAVVTSQAREITRLQTHLRRVSESVEASEADRILSTNPRPPHSG